MLIGGSLFLALVWIAVAMALGWKKSLLILAVLVLWLGAVVILARQRFFAVNPLVAPNLALGFFIIFEALRWVLASRTGKRFINNVSLPWITAIQTYRVAGIIFLGLYQAGTLPAVFALPSGIGDIIIGATAPIVAIIYLLKKPYANTLLVIWNVLGIADLVIALGTGFLAFPRPVQFLPTEVSTEPLALYPLVVIPLFSVPLALFLHIVGLKKVGIIRTNTNKSI